MSKGGGSVKILMLSNLYPPYVIGGAELIASYLAEGLVGQGHQVTVLTSKGPDSADLAGEGETPAAARGNPAVVRFFPENRYWLYDQSPRRTLDKARWHFRDLWNRKVGRRFGAMLDQIRPDVLHSHNIDGFSPIVWAEAKRRGIPVVHTAHDYHFLCPRSNLLNRHGAICETPHPLCRGWRGFYRLRLRDVDVFASPSRFLLDLYRREGVLAEGQGVVAANGVPLPASVVRPAVESGPLRLLYIGGLTESKGIRVVLAAMARLPAEMEVRLDIAGTGPLEAEVRAATAADRRIVYHGFVSGESKERLFDADLMVFSSLWYENMPTTILEASCRGMGVLASDLGATRDFVDERNGVRFPAGDATALAGLIARFQQDRARLEPFRRQAPTVTTDFTIPMMVARYIDIYRGLGCGA